MAVFALYSREPMNLPVHGLLDMVSLSAQKRCLQVVHEPLFIASSAAHSIKRMTDHKP
jgi:hypothetical protein